MRIKDIYKIIGVVLFMAFAVSCDMLRTAEQDASPVISPDGKPTVTYTANITGNTVKEGESLIYTITLDKPIDRALTFSANFVDGSAGEDDYEVATAVLQPYTTEVKLTITAIADDYPEVEETLKLEIGIFGIAEKYLINPGTVNPMVVDLKIANTNDPEKLTIAMEWADHDMDFDFVTWSDTPDYPMTEWGDSGASSHNPEIDKSIWLADPAGTYYVNIMDWDSGPFGYKFSIGYPNGNVEFIEGTFDKDANNYTNDPWTAWGDSYDSYRVLKVENTGTAFTVTKL
jgi:hypothetical protein